MSAYNYIEKSNRRKDVAADEKAGVNKMTHRIQLTHSLKAPGDNTCACPLTHREKPVTNFAFPIFN